MLGRSSFKTIRRIVLSAAAGAAADHSLPLHSRTQAIELGAQRCIDHARADLDDEATEQGGVDLAVQARFLAQLGFEHRFELRNFALAERPAGSDFGFGLAARL